jgi:hypothetical protein
MKRHSESAGDRGPGRPRGSTKDAPSKFMRTIINGKIVRIPQTESREPPLAEPEDTLQEPIEQEMST